MIEINGEGVVRAGGTDHEERIRWEQLVEVRIVTTDEGPMVEDIFWLLIGADGKGVAVPGADASPLLKTLQALPRFDNEAVIQATMSTDHASFVVWQGQAGEASILRQPPGS